MRLGQEQQVVVGAPARVHGLGLEQRAYRAQRLGALLVANHPLFTTRREQIIALAARYALPTMYVQREFAKAGGLLTYGTDLPEVYRLTGGYVGRILRGDKPGELPVLLSATQEQVSIEGSCVIPLWDDERD